MIEEILLAPAKIHTAYNPVRFKFKGEPNTLTNISIVVDDAIVVLKIQFNNVGESIINIAEILKSFFDKIDEITDSISIADNFQSFRYMLFVGEIKKEVNDFGKLVLNTSNHIKLGEYTTVRSAAQIGDSQDLARQHSKLLTGFDKLVVYDDYARDISTLTIEGNNLDESKWKGKCLIDNTINRLQINCKDKEVIAPFRLDFNAKWSYNADNVICQKIADIEGDYQDFRLQVCGQSSGIIDLDKMYRLRNVIWYDWRNQPVENSIINLSALSLSSTYKFSYVSQSDEEHSGILYLTKRNTKPVINNDITIPFYYFPAYVSIWDIIGFYSPTSILEYNPINVGSYMLEFGGFQFKKYVIDNPTVDTIVFYARNNNCLSDIKLTLNIMKN